MLTKQTGSCDVQPHKKKDKKKHKNKNCLVSRQTTAAREGEHSFPCFQRAVGRCFQVAQHGALSSVALCCSRSVRQAETGA